MMALTGQPRSTRVPVRLTINSATLDVFFGSEIINLAKGGVFIKADLTAKVGTEVLFEFTLPHSGQTISAKGVVVWSRRRGSHQGPSFADHPTGMGVQFTQLSDEHLRAILDEIEAACDEFM